MKEGIGINRSKLDNMNIPTNPGVYLMKREDGVIYVGKAKNLKKRVYSYFSKNHTSEKTKELVKNIKDIEVIICNTELDALVMENNLIKMYSPKYNIALKDEKTYPYIKFTKEDYSKIGIIRTTKAIDTRSGFYFGPYPFGVWELKKTLIKLFKLRDCNRDMKRTYDRPCLKYYMDLCMGPCVYKEPKKDYIEAVEAAKKLLKGSGSVVIKELQEKMKVASENMEFERAILYRNQIKKLEETLKNQVTQTGKDIDEDVFIFSVEGNRLFWCVLNIMEGKVLNKNSANLDLEDKLYSNLFQEVITDYYSKHTIPKNLILSYEYEEEKKLVSSWLSLKKESEVKLYFPKIKSRRKELLKMALLNLEKDIKDYYNRKKSLEKGLMQLYDILELRSVPRRIECFDISNIQGKDAVGAMSVALEGRLKKKEYRRFKIKTKDTPDDFHMMREVLTRRYSKLKREELPDLILIDGGLGQLSSAGRVLSELKKENFLDIISIAKREEEIFKLGENIPYVFDKSTESLKILQRLRDEAHRFGITYHRKLRSKRVIKSELDDIEGIGSARREMLLKTFGSVEAIKKVSLEELQSVLPKSVAEKVFRRLGEDG